VEGKLCCTTETLSLEESRNKRANSTREKYKDRTPPRQTKLARGQQVINDYYLCEDILLNMVESRGLLSILRMRSAFKSKSFVIVACGARRENISRLY
jgi:hypothetical protein